LYNEQENRYVNIVYHWCTLCLPIRRTNHKYTD